MCNVMEVKQGHLYKHLYGNTVRPVESNIKDGVAQVLVRCDVVKLDLAWEVSRVTHKNKLVNVKLMEEILP